MAPTKSKSKYSRADPQAQTSPIFEVDTTGSASIRHSVLHGSFASRARKGVKRTLRVDDILNQVGKDGPPAVAGRVRGVTRESAKARLLSATERKRLERMVIRKRHDSGVNSIDPEKCNGTAAAIKPPPAPAGDIWQPGSSVALAAATATPSVKVPAGLRQHETIAEVVEQLPADGLRAVPLPHPGQSYNPTLDDHQQILRKTLEKLEEEQRDADRAAMVNDRVTQGIKRLQAKTQWELCEEEVGDGESEEEQNEPKEETAVEIKKKKVAKKKTIAQRKRRARALEEERALAKKKEAKRILHSLHELPKIVNGLSAAEIASKQARLTHKAKRAALVAEYGLGAVRGGKPKGLKTVADTHEFQLTEDLTEAGLRGLKPEGNLWRDWSQSSIRRGKLESRPKIGLVKGQRFAKGRMFKEVEKHAWKNFEAWK